MPGITTPYGYLGRFGSTFAWHVEDVCLGSMNINLGGAGKVWYTLPREYKGDMDKILRKCFPQHFRKCASFGQHKTCVVSPTAIGKYLGQRDRVYTHKQIPGDTMVTLYGAYHAGFSTGLNFGEAINFATDMWLSSFKEPPNSTCQSHNSSSLFFERSFWNRLRSQY